MKMTSKSWRSLYDKNTDLSSVNLVRQHIFSSTIRQVDSIPPTQAALKFHMLRSLLHARIWFHMDNKIIQEFRPEEYGWKLVDGTWVPFWTDLPEVGQLRYFIKCSCKDCSNHRCGCAKENLPCYEGCCCKGRCSQ